MNKTHIVKILFIGFLIAFTTGCNLMLPERTFTYSPVDVTCTKGPTEIKIDGDSVRAVNKLFASPIYIPDSDSNDDSNGDSDANKTKTIIVKPHMDKKDIKDLMKTCLGS